MPSPRTEDRAQEPPTIGVGLRGLELKQCYDSDEDDILDDFYIPALSVSNRYRRIAGFFSSSALAVAAQGIGAFIRRGGIMQILCSARLTEADLNAVRRGESSTQQVMEQSALRELNQLENEVIQDHVRALGWMVAQKRLQIKVALVRDEHGNVLPAESASEHLLFHQKVGILEDDVGDSISFSGSDNESAKGWTEHVEEFKVFRSWRPQEAGWFLPDLAKFQKFWENRGFRTEVYPVSEAVERRLIELAPRDIEELRLLSLARPRTLRRSVPRLFAHQLAAVEAWWGNDRRGVLEMATGTGKTFTALECVKRVMRDESSLVTVVSCPYDHLVKQWSDDVDEYGITCQTIVADSSAPGWKDRLANLLSDIRTGVSHKLIVLTTHTTLSSDDFASIIQRCNVPLMLVVDEVHGIGAPKRQTGLLDVYVFRLGLSATPKRYFDDEGTAAIFAYFGKTVYEFTLGQAIHTVNPATNKTFLTPYEYRPFFAHLDKDELEKYEAETRKIARTYYRATRDSERRELFQLLCIKRQEIVKNANAKYKALESILDGLGGRLEHCLIYCSDQQIDTVLGVLRRRGVNYHAFTMSEGTTPSSEYGGLSQREFLIQGLGDGTYQVLVAMKCLDEGVDIPTAEVGILLASSGNPKEFIQRRGRILRRPSPPTTKEKAVLFDVIIAPARLGTGDVDFDSLEREIFRKELVRYREFADDATNSLACLNLLHEVESH